MWYGKYSPQSESSLVSARNPKPTKWLRVARAKWASTSHMTHKSIKGFPLTYTWGIWELQESLQEHESLCQFFIDSWSHLCFLNPWNEHKIKLVRVNNLKLVSEIWFLKHNTLLFATKFPSITFSDLIFIIISWVLKMDAIIFQLMSFRTPIKKIETGRVINSWDHVFIFIFNL